MLPASDFRYWEDETHGYEPAVQNAIRDLVRPGRVAFDVGANYGGLTLALSRQVGPSGRVLAFEAGPRNIPRLNATILTNALTNVHVFHNAVFSESGKRLPIYQQHAGYADSLFSETAGDALDYRLVETITLDDAVARHGIVPHFVKMDIEFAEFDALKGAQRLLDTRAPLFVMEVWKQHPEAVLFLLDRGYCGVSLETLEPFADGAAFERAAVANALFWPPDAAIPPVYRRNRRTIWKTVSGAALSAAFAAGKIVVRLEAEPGKYVVHLGFACAGEKPLIMTTTAGRAIAAQFYASARHLGSLPSCVTVTEAGVLEIELAGQSQALLPDDVREIAIESVVPA